MIPFYSKNLDAIPRLLIDSIVSSHTDNILDLGCGYGYLFYALSCNKLLPDRSVGIDIEYENCRQLKKKVRDATVLCGDVYKILNPKRDLFDYIVCEQVIEHLQDERTLLGIIYKLLREGGKLHISSIVRRKYAWWLYRYKGEVRLNPDHVKEYTSEREFVSLLEHNSFKVIESNMTRFPFPLFDWLEIILLNFKLLTSETLNHCYERVPLLRFMKKRLVFFIPGFYIVEALAQKI